MSDKNWIVNLKKLDYQGYYKDGKKVVGRNHLLLIANGYVGVRGNFAEIFDEKVDNSTHVIGIYDQVGYDDPSKEHIWKEIINMPDFMSAPMIFDDEQVFLNRKGDNFENFNIELDMRTAILTLSYVWKSKKGNRLKVEIERFCAFNEKNLAYNKANITSLDAEGELKYSTGIHYDVFDANGRHLENFLVDECTDGYILTANTQQHGYKVAISGKNTLSCNAKGEIVKTEESIRENFTINLKAGEEFSITTQNTLYTSRDSMDPVADALQADYEYEAVKAGHLELFSKHWETTNVEIDVDEEYVDKYLVNDIKPVVADSLDRDIKYGNVKAENRESELEKRVKIELERVKKSELFMRYNLYILLVSIPKDYDYASIPSRSLSYSTYKGATFWEVDTYAFPYYAAVFPEYAKNLLAYRYKSLEYAIKKANDLGYEGAYFAWESLDTGEESTKKFVWQDIHSGRMMRNYFGDRQYHIAGDVIYSVWQYYDITGDWEFIENYGAQMTLLTARFVGSLAYFNVRKDRYEILHTTCPDEYHEEEKNNTFTNRILQFSIEKAFELIEMMSERCPEKLNKLLQINKIDEEELAYWEDVAKKMYIIPADPSTKVIEQHEEYFDLEDISLEEFKSRVIRDEYLGYPSGPATHTQIIKQADTIQMLVMFKKEFHPIVRKATFDYYDLRTEHGSGDSPNAYGIVAAQVGLIDRALWYFLRSARIDLESANPATKANFQLGGVHIAPSGGTWQVIHYGFAGFELEDGILKFNPIMPKGWNRVKYQFTYQGNDIVVEMDRKNIKLTSKDDNNDVEIKVNDKATLTLVSGATISSDYKKMGNHYYTYNQLGVEIEKEKKIER